MIKKCLDVYKRASGQTVNFHKSSIVFSGNTQVKIRQEVSGIFGVEQNIDFGKYLGLPSFIGRNKRAVFSYIDLKIRHYIGGWNKKFLSNVGKEILLKSVAQSMPTYSMSIYLLPTTFCTELERCMNKFWWGKGSTSGTRIH